MTLLSDTRYVFVRYMRKLVRTPILLFFSLFQPILVSRIVHTVIDETWQFSRNFAARSRLFGVCNCRNSDAKRFWKCLAIG